MIAQEKEEHNIEDLSSSPQNTREEAPLLLTRGVQTEIFRPSASQKTRLDWFSFTADESVDILKQFCDIVFPGCVFVKSKGGTQGYKSFFSISYNGEYQGQINYNGTTSRNQFLLAGNGCEKVQDWFLVYQWLKVLKEPKITFIHICLDDYEGKFVNRDLFEQAFVDKKFMSSKSRKNPSRSVHEDWYGDGYSKGRTTNIGKTKQFTKCCTGYEKGKEQFLSLFAKLPDSEQRTLIDRFTLEDLNVQFPSGVSLNTSILKWYRVEVKLASRDVLIPLEAILETDKYFAGAYPYTKELLSSFNPEVEGATPTRLPTNTERHIEEMFVNCGNSYGSSIYTALLVANSQGLDLKEYCLEIVQKIIKGHCLPSQKIIKTGSLADLKPFDIAEIMPSKNNEV